MQRVSFKVFKMTMTPRRIVQNEFYVCPCIQALELKLAQFDHQKSVTEAEESARAKETKWKANLLELLREDIKRKEEYLECPVCFGTSTVPTVSRGGQTRAARPARSRRQRRSWAPWCGSSAA